MKTPLFLWTYWYTTFVSDSSQSELIRALQSPKQYLRVYWLQSACLLPWSCRIHSIHSNRLPFETRASSRDRCCSDRDQYHHLHFLDSLLCSFDYWNLLFSFRIVKDSCDFQDFPAIEHDLMYSGSISVVNFWRAIANYFLRSSK